jgi:hypothetical protein
MARLKMGPCRQAVLGHDAIVLISRPVAQFASWSRADLRDVGGPNRSGVSGGSGIITQSWAIAGEAVAIMSARGANARFMSGAGGRLLASPSPRASGRSGWSRAGVEKLTAMRGPGEGLSDVI